ncbi:MAG: hypothetical protein C4293_19470, partial [Nitrospiraceae bacterium]
MEQQRTTQQGSSRVTWGTLEAWIRDQVQGVIQRVLEEEASEFVGRQKSQRRCPLDAPVYRNG